MAEVEEEARHVPSHQQRTVLFLSAMRHFAVVLEGRGMPVTYSRLDTEDNTQSFAGELQRAFESFAPERVTAVRPGEHRVLSILEEAVAKMELPFELLPDERFLCSSHVFTDWAEGRSSLVMEHFYRFQRKRFGILLDDDGKPEGGDWNYDSKNRQSFSQAPDVPDIPAFEPDVITEEVIALVKKRFPGAPGRLDAFRWPVTPAQAEEVLHHFIEHRLPTFGRYQDAMWSGEPFLFHSLLSPPLNLGLIHPERVIDAALAAWRADRAPLPAVEGFVRQILGWREFIRGVYWLEGADYGERNGLDHQGRLAEMYWSGETDMKCMEECLDQVLEHGYGHHIQRLMVTGNFALIAGIHPREVSDWYLGMYVDAVDWVTLPNTLGMTLHADGGIVGTKPYAASGKYIDRMSNYCGDCRYSLDQRHGEDACPFVTFYWDFLLHHQQRFSNNRRMSLMLNHLDKMDAAERKAIRRHGDQLRRRFGTLAEE